MGSGLSRSKRIAPVCVAEINVSKRDAAAAGPRPGEARTSSRTRRFKIPNFTHAAPPCSHDSPRFTEEEDEEEKEEDEEEDGNRGKLDRACDGEDRGDVSQMKNGPKKSSFVKSRTYGVLCNFRRVDSNKELNFTPTTTTTNTTNTNTTAAAAATPSQAFTSSESHHHHGQECGPGDVNRNGNSVSSHVRRHGPTACSSHQEHTSFQGLGPAGHACAEQVPRAGNDSSFANCLNTPVATPVTRYDGSEEELMDTIERDFS